MNVTTFIVCSKYMLLYIHTARANTSSHLIVNSRTLDTRYQEHRFSIVGDHACYSYKTRAAIIIIIGSD